MWWVVIEPHGIEYNSCFNFFFILLFNLTTTKTNKHESDMLGDSLKNREESSEGAKEKKRQAIRAGKKRHFLKMWMGRGNA